MQHADMARCLQELIGAQPALVADMSPALLCTWQAFTRALKAESNQAARSAYALGAARLLDKWGLDGLNYAASNLRMIR